MSRIEKVGERDADDSSLFSSLPDEIILRIFNKLIDLKTLCFSYLVSTRFSSIVLQVDTISFIVPLLKPSISDENTFDDIDGGGCPIELFRQLINGVYSEPLFIFDDLNLASSKPCPSISSSFSSQSFRSSVSFLSKFRGLKSLCIELPCNDDQFLVKWKANFGNKIESFAVLLPDSISAPDEDHVTGNGDEEDEEDMDLSDDLYRQRVHIASQCLKEVILRHRMLMYIVKDLPMLEEVSITDSGRRGKLSLAGEKLSEVKESLHSTWGTVKSEMNRIEVPVCMYRPSVPVLELPVSGLVMKGVSFFVMEMKHIHFGFLSFMKREDCCEDEEYAVCNEAVMEMLKHMGWGRMLELMQCEGSEISSLLRSINLETL